MITFKLTGRIGQDAKKTTFESGKTVIEFSIAENYTYRSNGEKVTDTTWHECKLWCNGESAQIADYLKKGTLISVSGYLRYQNVKDSKLKRAFIQVQDVKLLAKLVPTRATDHLQKRLI